MASAKRSCRNNPDVFCYICGEYTIALNRKPITSFIRRVYHAYFGIKLADQDKAWAQLMVCKACTETLREWTNGKRSRNFGIPMVWREPTNHVPDCYFCADDVTGINSKNRGSLKYPDLQSARRLVAHCDELPDISDEDASSVEDEKEVVLEDDDPYPFSQKELNHLVRDLSLSTDSAELLVSRLKEKKPPLWQSSHQLLPQQASRVPPFFLDSEGPGVLCRYCAASAQAWSATVPTQKLETVHWQQKCVLLHNSNQFASVPIPHPTTLKEKYEAVKYVLEKIGYDQHKWFICVDLKMVNILLGQQSGFTKYPCVLCMWDSRDRAQHYTKKDWPLWEELVPCKERNVINDLLVDRDRILFTPLHIKFVLIKQFTKALGKDGDCFTYLCQAFPGLTMEKLKAGIFDGPQRSRVRKLNERRGTGSVEGVFSGCEELSWQQ